MIRRYPFAIFYLLVLCGPLWGQPDFRWPVDMDGVSNLTGNLGEPRPNDIDNPTVHLDHWHKGIDIPKTNGETIRIPADGTIFFIGETKRSIVLYHRTSDGYHWYTKITHINVDRNLRVTQVLRVQADDTMPVVGTVRDGHCHLEVYQFDEQQDKDMVGSFVGNVANVRNPLNYDNLDDYPDEDYPAVMELRFTSENRWGGLSTLETVDFNEKFKNPLDEFSYPIYFLAQAYDDITPTGATGPYSVEFSIWDLGFYGDDLRKISTFKYQFDDLRAADGTDLQLEEVYAEGTQANNLMFYFSKQIDLFSVPLNVDRSGNEIDNFAWSSLNTHGEWRPFRFKVEVMDKSDNPNYMERDIYVPSMSPHAFSDILVDSFSAEWQENYVHIDFRVFDSEKVEGFNILRRSADEPTFVPVHPDPLTIHPTSEMVDPWQSSSTLFSYDDVDLVPGETYFYALEVLWQSGRRDILEHLVTKVCVPDGGHVTQQSQQSKKEIL